MTCNILIKVFDHNHKLIERKVILTQFDDDDDDELPLISIQSILPMTCKIITHLPLSFFFKTPWLNLIILEVELIFISSVSFIITSIILSFSSNSPLIWILDDDQEECGWSQARWILKSPYSLLFPFFLVRNRMNEWNHEFISTQNSL